jgi:hypothetical protein
VLVESQYNRVSCFFCQGLLLTDTLHTKLGRKHNEIKAQSPHMTCPEDYILGSATKRHRKQCSNTSRVHTTKKKEISITQPILVQIGTPVAQNAQTVQGNNLASTSSGRTKAASSLAMSGMSSLQNMAFGQRTQSPQLLSRTAMLSARIVFWLSW